MAIGDKATEAGIPLTLGAALANTIDTEINALKDVVGALKLSLPARIRTGSTLPGNTGNTVGEVFVKY